MPAHRRSPEEIKRSFENAKKVMAHQKKKEREKDVRWARGALMVVGVFQALNGIYFFQRFGVIASLIIDGGLGAGFIGLSIHAKKKPVQALTIGLAVYIGVIVLGSLIMGTSPFSGILLKIIIISILLSGIRAAKKLPQQKEPDEDLLDDDLV